MITPKTMNNLKFHLFRVLLFCVGAGFFGAGCSNDDDPAREIASKVTLTLSKYYANNGAAVLPVWSRSDKAGLFVMDRNIPETVYATPIQAGAQKSLFLFTLNAPVHTAPTVIGFWPPDANLSCENGVLKTTIPTTQTGTVTPCLIGRATARLDAYEGCDMELSHLFCTMYVPVWGSSAIRKMVVNADGGEAIAGEITVGTEDAAIGAAEKTVTVDFPTPLDCSKETQLVPVMIAPVTLSQGYTVTLTDTDGNSFQVGTTEPVTLEAGGRIDTDEALSPYVVEVMSFNIRVDNAMDGENVWANRKQGVVTMIERQQPTVMGLQEAQAHQITYLAKHCPEYAWYGLGRDTGEAPPETDTYSFEECMPIFFHTPTVELLDKGTFWLSETPGRPSKGWDANYNRSCTWGLFRQKATGKRFYFFNTHLDNSGTVARKESIELIIAKINEINTEELPVFLTADFNSDTDEACFNPLHQAMKDARATAYVTDQEATYNAYKETATRKLDHIFYSGGSVASIFRTLKDNYGVPYISDHYPVTTSFVLTH